MGTNPLATLAAGFCAIFFADVGTQHDSVGKGRRAKVDDGDRAQMPYAFSYERGMDAGRFRSRS
jgi:hypothetical protein